MDDTVLLSKRIRLRMITINDLEFIHDLHSLPETDQYNTLGIPGSIEETKAIIKIWIEENNLNDIKNYTFAIEQKENSKVMGLFGLRLSDKKFKSAEVWYKIHKDYWNQGFATESLNTIIDFGFDTLNLHRIVAGCAVENLGSIKVLEKMGMTREGRHREILPLKSGWSDNYEYAILESDKRKINSM
jgi:RimJ/RimL family protein N-acetyltransferase